MIGSDKGLVPRECQTIHWNSADLFLWKFEKQKSQDLFNGTNKGQ